jgi:hypothetical protein
MYCLADEVSPGFFQAKIGAFFCARLPVSHGTASHWNIRIYLLFNVLYGNLRIRYNEPCVWPAKNSVFLGPIERLSGRSFPQSGDCD